MSFSTPNFSILGGAKGLLKFFVVRRDTQPSFTLHSVAANDSTALVRRETGSTAAVAKADSSGNDNSSSDGGSAKNDKELNSLEAAVLDVVVSTVASLLIFAVCTGIWTISKSLFQMRLGQEDAEGNDVDQFKSGAVHRLTELLKKRGREPKGPLRLTSHESHLAEDIIDPDEIDEGFADIGGMDHLKQEIWELAILPLLRPELFRSKSKLLQQPSGILLYGKPGCGKTLLAKAIAKESAAVFIPIKLSKILNKWVGESNKLVNATFSLARKLAPSVIFLDEVHCFLSDSVDPSASKSMESLKAEFLTLWDGVSTNGNHAPVLVLGATNHPHLIDQAILRRMPRTFAVPLPNEEGREQILNVLLRDQPMDTTAVAFLPLMAYKRTKGYSGSDLKELCRTAAREPIREITREQARRAVMGEKPLSAEQRNIEEDDEEEEEEVRPVSREDFELALTKVKKTGQAAREYGRGASMENAGQEAMSYLSDLDPMMLQQALRQLLGQLPNNGQNGSNKDDIGDVPNV